MQSTPATRKARNITEVGYSEAWQQLVKSAANTEDATLFRLVSTAASSRELIRSMKRSRIKRLFLVEGSYQLTAYNIVAMAARKFSLCPAGNEYQQWCKAEGIKQQAMADILKRIADLHTEFGYPPPEGHEFQHIHAGSPEAWQFIDHLMAGHCLRLLHQGYHDEVGPITGKGKVTGLSDVIAVGEIIPVNQKTPAMRYRFEGTATPLEILQLHATEEVVDLHGLDEAGNVQTTIDVVYDNRSIIERDARFTEDQLKGQAFSSAVRLHYDVVSSGLWRRLPDILPPHTRLVAELDGTHMRGTPIVMRQRLQRFLQERLLYCWHYQPSSVELPKLTASHPVIRKVTAVTFGADPLTGQPLKAYGTVCRVPHSSASGPYFGIRWVLDREVAKQLRERALKDLAPIIAKLKEAGRLDHADAVQQAAAIATLAERLARSASLPASAETLRRLQQLPHPAISHSAQETRAWATNAHAEIESILKAARAKRQAE